MSAKHWAEIPPLELKMPELAEAEKEQIVRMRPVDVIGAKLYPNPCQFVPKAEVFDDSILCKRTLHTIQLRKYYEQLQSLYQSLQKKPQQDSVEEAEKNLPSIPSMPEIEISQTHTSLMPKTSSASLFCDFIKRQEECSNSQSSIVSESYFEKSDFAKGIGEPPVSITRTAAWAALRKAVATMCLHCGFDMATDLALDNLTDAAEYHMKKLCQSLNYNVFLKTYPIKLTIVPDALELTLQEAQVGGIITLHQFYKTRVIQYHENLMQSCSDLQHECEVLRNSKIKQPEIQVEEMEPDVIEVVDDVVVDDYQESLPAPSHRVFHPDESERGFTDREINNWSKEIIGPIVESGFASALSSLDIAKESSSHDTPPHSVATSLDISQQLSSGVFSASNSPISSVESSRPSRPLRKKKKA